MASVLRLASRAVPSAPLLSARPAATRLRIDQLQSPSSQQSYTITTDSTQTVSTLSSSASSSRSRTPIQPPSPQSAILPWGEYFAARRKRKRYDTGGSVFTALGSAAGAWNGLSSLDIEKMMSGELILGMDPLMFLGIATVGVTFVGWVIGPTIGTAVFFLFRGKDFKRAMIQRDADFFNRIASRRPSAEGSSASNIIPDWYGEKVVDIATYRTWLRRQRQFVKKREHALKK